MNNSRRNRYKGKNKKGKPCGAAATAGGLCFFHANPDKASELGRIGGRRNRHVSAEKADPLPSLDSALAVRKAIARLVDDVYSGKLQPRIASGLAPLLSLQFRVIETADLEQGLAEIRRYQREIQEERKARLGSENQISDVRQAPMTSPESEIGSAEGNRNHADGSGVGDAQSD